MMIVLCCFLLYLSQMTSSSMFEIMGPYWLTITGLENCPNQGRKEVVYDLHLKKIDEKITAMYGNIIFKRPFDRNLKVKIKNSVWVNGGWQATYQTVLDNACKIFYDLLGKEYENLWAAAGYHLTDPCNIPPNNYQLKDFVVTNWSFKKVPIMLYGKYCVTIAFYSEDNTLLGCWKIIYEVTKRGSGAAWLEAPSSGSNSSTPTPPKKTI